MKRWLILLAVLGFASLTVAAPTAQAASKTLYVGTCKEPSPYTTIQSAVDAATGAGFTIAVCPGTYNESVDVANRERLSIRSAAEKSQGMPLIDAGGSDGIVIRDSTNVEVRSLQITNTSMGIVAAHAPKTEIRDMVITNAKQYGIFFTGSDKSEAQKNRISGSGFAGIAAGDTPNVSIKQNSVTSFNYGIYIFSSTNAKIVSNHVTNAGQTGILLANLTRSTVKHNTASGSSYGITLGGTNSNTISENTVTNNSTAGILVESSAAGNTIRKNLMQGNGTDAVDQSTGSQTTGTANIWLRNTCATSTPAGLCK
jgi:parallel beta-helix repeat protein